MNKGTRGGKFYIWLNIREFYTLEDLKDYQNKYCEHCIWQVNSKIIIVFSWRQRTKQGPKKKIAIILQQ